MNKPAATPAARRETTGLMSVGRGVWAPLSVLGALVAVVASSWTGFVLREQQEDQWRTLDAVAQLKAQQLGDWLEQHMRSAEAIGSAELLGRDFEAWQDEGDRAAGERVVARLVQVAETGRFSAVVLADGEGRPLWEGLGSHPEPSAGTQAKWVAAAASGTAQMLGPFLDEAGTLHLDYVVALALNHGSPRGILVLHTGTEDFLPAGFSRFPLPWDSGEVALVRRDGDQVVHLMPRTDTRAALEVRTPIGDGRRPAAQLLLAEGAGPLRARGRDPHGRLLMKSGERVAGTDWMVLASLDTGEVRREALGKVLWITLLGGLLFLAAGAALIVNRQQRRLVELQAREREQDAQLRAFHLLHAVADSSNDPIFVKDLEGRYALVNRACCEFFGRPAAEVLGRTDEALFPPDQAKNLAETDRRVIDARVTLNIREVLKSARGERVISTIKGPLYDAEGQFVGMFGIARDMTEQERAAEGLEAHARELAARNLELERFNEAMVGRELDMLRLKHEVNELCARLGIELRYGREVIRPGHATGREEGEA